MDIAVNYRDVRHNPDLDDKIKTEVERAVRRFSGRLTRVEVHIGDQNGRKRTPGDKRCVIEARPARMHPITVEAEGDHVIPTARAAAAKLRRAVERRIDKRRVA